MTTPTLPPLPVTDAESKHLADVMIIGYDDDGHLYIQPSRLTCAQPLFLANKAAREAETGGEL